MGTRGFVGWVIDGIEKIAYNHWDSYPSGLGVEVLRWLHEAVEDRGALRRAVTDLRVVPADSSPTAEDVERLRDYADATVGRQTLDDWYVLLRRTQGDPTGILEAGVIVDASNFPSDSLAEWGYLVDLDANVFEVYRGDRIIQRQPHGKGRFASRKTRGDEFWPVALVASWPVDSLPDEPAFLKRAHMEQDASGGDK